jgi:cell division protein FtsX
MRAFWKLKTIPFLIASSLLGGLIIFSIVVVARLVVFSLAQILFSTSLDTGFVLFIPNLDAFKYIWLVCMFLGMVLGVLIRTILPFRKMP